MKHRASYTHRMEVPDRQRTNRQTNKRTCRCKAVSLFVSQMEIDTNMAGKRRISKHLICMIGFDAV